MVEVLESAVRKGKRQVPISTLKRLFRSRFHIELSETALGYTKLSDLLQDEVFSDICSVKLLERGYVVLPTDVFSQKSLTELKLLHASCQQRDAIRCDFPRATDCEETVHNTFVQLGLKSTQGKRSQSVPKDVGSRLGDSDAASTTDDRSTEIGSGSASPTLTASPLWSPRHQHEYDVPCPRWCLDDIYAAFPTCGLEQNLNANNAFACLPVVMPAVSSFCPVTCSNGWFDNDTACPPSWTAVVEAACTPCVDFEPEYLSKKACDGSIVRNTFIEMVSSPRIPDPSHRRAQSLPRNLGSNKIQSDDSFLVKPMVAQPAAAVSAYNTEHLQAAESTKCVLCLSEFI